MILDFRFWILDLVRVSRIKFPVLVFFLSLVLWSLSANAASLTAEIQPLSLRPRSDAPMMVDVRLTSNVGHPLEGQLEMDLMDGPMVLYTYRTDDIVITPGKQSHRFILPAPASVDSGMAVHMRFIGRNGEIDLGNTSFPATSAAERSFAICVSNPWSQADSKFEKIARSLRFERFDPSTDSPVHSVITSMQSLPPEDLPYSPLGYFSCDIVFLADEGFSLLKEKQLDAIARWVEAGGSVCILPGGELKPHHTDFLNKLTGGAASPQNGNGLYRFGLGRAAVIQHPPDPDKDFDSPAWRAVMAHLWKIRSAQWSAVVDKGAWRTDLQKGGADEGIPRQYYYNAQGKRQTAYVSSPNVSVPLQMGLRSLAGGIALSQLLKPSTVRVMPFWLLVLILAAFLIAIGPLDYFVLGLLKRRKLTWLTFPVMAVGATVVIMQFAQHYMGNVDYRTTLRIIDIGKNNTVLRETRCEGIFTAGQKTVSTELRNAFFAPISDNTQSSYYNVYGRQRPSFTERAPVFAGRIPGGFTVSQQAQQWALQCNRITSLEPIDPPQKLNWESITISDLRHSKDYALFPKLTDRGNFFVFHEFGYGFPATEASPFSELLRPISVRPQNGLFSVVSQISPNSAGSLEDLSLLDPTDPNQWLVVVVIEKDGGGSDVYRRLYVGDSK